ncbi:hypothetical protein AMATHDRAFT_100132, partial [Amanita thiersii Skay4041]
TTPLPRPIPVYNADGTVRICPRGSLTHTVKLRMRIRDHEEVMDFGVSKLSKHEIFLGFDWLRHHNPKIDWKAAEL